MKYILILVSILFVLSLTSCLAADITTDRANRLAFGYVLYISDVTTNPLQIAPGSNGALNFNLENIGDQYLKDIRIELTLPAELAAYQDTSKKKIDYMAAGDIKPISFKLIAIPGADEGIYKIPVSLTYLNSIGDERNENNTISIAVGSSPILAAELKSADIYNGNLLGTIKIKIINNNVGNVKFLGVNLGASNDYKIIGGDSSYIGDLNSDDFSEVSFKVDIKDDMKSVTFPVVLSYKDALNRDYQQKLELTFNIPTAKEAGIAKSYTVLFVIIIILSVAGFIIYRKYFRNAIKHNKKGPYIISSKI